jgi:hypothetical protein
MVVMLILQILVVVQGRFLVLQLLVAAAVTAVTAVALVFLV